MVGQGSDSDDDLLTKFFWHVQRSVASFLAIFIVEEFADGLGIQPPFSALTSSPSSGGGFLLRSVKSNKVQFL